MIHEQFIEFETAKLAKQAGFDWECHYRYSEKYVTNDSDPIYISPSDNWNQDSGLYSAPTQAVLQRWLREVKNCEVKVYSVDGTNWCKDEPKRWWQCDIGTLFGWYWTGEELKQGKRNTTYEAALEAGLQKCLTLIIEKQ